MDAPRSLASDYHRTVSVYPSDDRTFDSISDMWGPSNPPSNLSSQQHGRASLRLADTNLQHVHDAAQPNAFGLQTAGLTPSGASPATVGPLTGSSMTSRNFGLAVMPDAVKVDSPTRTSHGHASLDDVHMSLQDMLAAAARIQNELLASASNPPSTSGPDSSSGPSYPASGRTQADLADPLRPTGAGASGSLTAATAGVTTTSNGSSSMLTSHSLTPSSGGDGSGGDGSGGGGSAGSASKSSSMGQPRGPLEALRDELFGGYKRVPAGQAPSGAPAGSAAPVGASGVPATFAVAPPGAAPAAVPPGDGGLNFSGSAAGIASPTPSSVMHHEHDFASIYSIPESALNAVAQTPMSTTTAAVSELDTPSSAVSRDEDYHDARAFVSPPRAGPGRFGVGVGAAGGGCAGRGGVTGTGGAIGGGADGGAGTVTPSTASIPSGYDDYVMPSAWTSLRERHSGTKSAVTQEDGGGGEGSVTKRGTPLGFGFSAAARNVPGPSRPALGASDSGAPGLRAPHTNTTSTVTTTTATPTPTAAAATPGTSLLTTRAASPTTSMDWSPAEEDSNRAAGGRGGSPPGSGEDTPSAPSPPPASPSSVSLANGPEPVLAGGALLHRTPSSAHEDRQTTSARPHAASPAPTTAPHPAPLLVSVDSGALRNGGMPSSGPPTLAAGLGGGGGAVAVPRVRSAGSGTTGREDSGNGILYHSLSFGASSPTAAARNTIHEAANSRLGAHVATPSREPPMAGKKGEEGNFGAEGVRNRGVGAAGASVPSSPAGGAELAEASKANLTDGDRYRAVCSTVSSSGSVEGVTGAGQATTEAGMRTGAMSSLVASRTGGQQQQREVTFDNPLYGTESLRGSAETTPVAEEASGVLGATETQANVAGASPTEAIEMEGAADVANRGLTSEARTSATVATPASALAAARPPLPPGAASSRTPDTTPSNAFLPPTPPNPAEPAGVATAMRSSSMSAALVGSVPEQNPEERVRTWAQATADLATAAGAQAPQPHLRAASQSADLPSKTSLTLGPSAASSVAARQAADGGDLNQGGDAVSAVLDAELDRLMAMLSGRGARSEVHARMAFDSFRSAVVNAVSLPRPSSTPGLATLAAAMAEASAAEAESAATAAAGALPGHESGQELSSLGGHGTGDVAHTELAVAAAGPTHGSSNGPGQVGLPEHPQPHLHPHLPLHPELHPHPHHHHQQQQLQHPAPGGATQGTAPGLVMSQQLAPHPHQQQHPGLSPSASMGSIESEVAAERLKAKTRAYLQKARTTTSAPSSDTPTTTAATPPLPPSHTPPPPAIPATTATTAAGGGALGTVPPSGSHHFAPVVLPSVALAAAASPYEDDVAAGMQAAADQWGAAEEGLGPPQSEGGSLLRGSLGGAGLSLSDTSLEALDSLIRQAEAELRHHLLSSSAGGAGGDRSDAAEAGPSGVMLTPIPGGDRAAAAAPPPPSLAADPPAISALEDILSQLRLLTRSSGGGVAAAAAAAAAAAVARSAGGSRRNSRDPALAQVSEHERSWDAPPRPVPGHQGRKAQRSELAGATAGGGFESPGSFYSSPASHATGPGPRHASNPASQAAHAPSALAASRPMVASSLGRSPDSAAAPAASPSPRRRRSGSPATSGSSPSRARRRTGLAKDSAVARSYPSPGHPDPATGRPRVRSPGRRSVEADAAGAPLHAGGGPNARDAPSHPRPLNPGAGSGGGGSNMSGGAATPTRGSLSSGLNGSSSGGGATSPSYLELMMQANLLRERLDAQQQLDQQLYLGGGGGGGMGRRVGGEAEQKQQPAGAHRGGDPGGGDAYPYGAFAAGNSGAAGGGGVAVAAGAPTRGSPPPLISADSADWQAALESKLLPYDAVRQRAAALIDASTALVEWQAEAADAAAAYGTPGVDPSPSRAGMTPSPGRSGIARRIDGASADGGGGRGTRPASPGPRGNAAASANMYRSAPASPRRANSPARGIIGAGAGNTSTHIRAGGGAGGMPSSAAAGAVGGGGGPYAARSPSGGSGPARGVWGSGSILDRGGGNRTGGTSLPEGASAAAAGSPSAAASQAPAPTVRPPPLPAEPIAIVRPFAWQERETRHWLEDLGLLVTPADEALPLLDNPLRNGLLLATLATRLTGAPLPGGVVTNPPRDVRSARTNILCALDHMGLLAANWATPADAERRARAAAAAADMAAALVARASGAAGAAGAGGSGARSRSPSPNRNPAAGPTAGSSGIIAIKALGSAGRGYALRLKERQLRAGPGLLAEVESVLAGMADSIWGLLNFIRLVCAPHYLKGAAGGAGSGGGPGAAGSRRPGEEAPRRSFNVRGGPGLEGGAGLRPAPSTLAAAIAAAAAADAGASPHPSIARRGGVTPGRSRAGTGTGCASAHGSSSLVTSHFTPHSPAAGGLSSTPRRGPAAGRGSGTPTAAADGGGVDGGGGGRGSDTPPRRQRPAIAAAGAGAGKSSGRGRPSPVLVGTADPRGCLSVSMTSAASTATQPPTASSAAGGSGGSGSNGTSDASGLLFRPLWPRLAALPYNSSELATLEASLLRWLQESGAISRREAAEGFTALLPMFEDGTFVCWLVSNLSGQPIVGAHRRPLTEAARRTNWLKAIEALRKLPAMSRRFLVFEEALIHCERAPLTGLLEDLHRLAGGAPPAPSTLQSNAKPYLPYTVPEPPVQTLPADCLAVNRGASSPYGSHGAPLAVPTSTSAHASHLSTPTHGHHHRRQASAPAVNPPASFDGFPLPDQAKPATSSQSPQQQRSGRAVAWAPDTLQDPATDLSRSQGRSGVSPSRGVGSSPARGRRRSTSRSPSRAAAAGESPTPQRPRSASPARLTEDNRAAGTVAGAAGAAAAPPMVVWRSRAVSGGGAERGGDDGDGGGALITDRMVTPVKVLQAGARGAGRDGQGRRSGTAAAALSFGGAAASSVDLRASYPSASTAAARALDALLCSGGGGAGAKPLPYKEANSLSYGPGPSGAAGARSASGGSGASRSAGSGGGGTIMGGSNTRGTNNAAKGAGWHRSGGGSRSEGGGLASSSSPAPSPRLRLVPAAVP